MTGSAKKPAPASLPVTPPSDSGVVEAAPQTLAELQDAFRLFNDASERFSSHYARLEKQVENLNRELEEANGKLRMNLREKQKVEDYLSTVLESLPIGVVGLDPSGRASSCNRSAAEILECRPEEVRQTPVAEIFRTLERLTLLREAVETGFQSEIAFETGFIRPSDGKQRVLRIQVVPTKGREKQNAAGVLLLEDVTDIRRLQHQADRNNRLAAMGEIAMNVAHEIRNPLGSIELFASMLQRDLAADPTNGPLAAHICTGVRRVDHIVSNILQFSQPQKLGCSAFNLVDLIDETLVFAEHAIRLKKLAVQRTSKEADVRIWADAEMLKQVLLNLILNAIQATPENGHIGIGACGTGECAEIQVWDTGCGIDRQNIARIFDPFFTTRRKGTGLGLTIVHNIVSAHGGSIEADNRPEGGAIFTIILPKKAIKEKMQQDSVFSCSQSMEEQSCLVES